MIRKVEGDAWAQPDIEPAEFQCIDVGGEVCKEGKAFADIADAIAEVG